jgi:hypothetical protein
LLEDGGTSIGAFLTSSESKPRDPQEVEDIEPRQAKYMMEALEWKRSSARAGSKRAFGLSDQVHVHGVWGFPNN